MSHISFEQNRTFWKPSWVTVFHLEHILILFLIDFDVLGLTTFENGSKLGFLMMTPCYLTVSGGEEGASSVMNGQTML
jgi:hypothetical protein